MKLVFLAAALVATTLVATSAQADGPHHKIGIIGSGKVGGALGKLWAKACAACTGSVASPRSRATTLPVPIGNTPSAAPVPTTPCNASAKVPSPPHTSTCVTPEATASAACTAAIPGPRVSSASHPSNRCRSSASTSGITRAAAPLPATGLNKTRAFSNTNLPVTKP